MSGFVCFFFFNKKKRTKKIHVTKAEDKTSYLKKFLLDTCLDKFQQKSVENREAKMSRSPLVVA